MATRNYFALSSVLFIVAVLPHFGVVLQPEGKDAVIVKTQTDPISHKKKTEELKEGPKGAPSPSFEYYGHQKFLSELPVDGKIEDQRVEDFLPIPGDPIPENLAGLEDEKAFEEGWWLEDWSDIESGEVEEPIEEG